MERPKLFRKRLIPAETIHLKDDRILFTGSSKIITGWNALRPKKELHHGYSCYYLDEGYKVSKFYRKDSSLLYWYCDIIHTDHSAADNTYVFTDLLADVIIYPDGFVKVVDLDEIAEALERELLPLKQAKEALIILDRLLKLIYEGQFQKLQSDIDLIENELSKTHDCR